MSPAAAPIHGSDCSVWDAPAGAQPDALIRKAIATSASSFTCRRCARSMTGSSGALGRCRPAASAADARSRLSTRRSHAGRHARATRRGQRPPAVVARARGRTPPFRCSRHAARHAEGERRPARSSGQSIRSVGSGSRRPDEMPVRGSSRFAGCSGAAGGHLTRRFQGRCCTCRPRTINHAV